MRIRTDYQYHAIACKGSDHLQLIKFWQTRAPGKGSATGLNFLAPPYYSQRAVFACLWAIFHYTNRNRNTTRELRHKKWNGRIRV